LIRRVIALCLAAWWDAFELLEVAALDAFGHGGDRAAAWAGAVARSAKGVSG